MDIKGLRSGSTWRGLIAATIAGAATLAAAGAANAGDWKKGRGYYSPYGPPVYVAVPPGHAHYYAPAPVYYAPAPRPVVVYPAPVAYVPAPVYSAPVYSAPAYYGPPGGNVSLGINLPLR